MAKGSHYTNRERELLATLVKDHPLLESKKTDNSTVKEKNVEWEKLTKEYNGQPEVNTTRCSSQLKMLWKNLKQKKRKQTTFERHEALLTGGGPPARKSNDPLMALVEEAAPSMDVYLCNTFDSTAAFENNSTIHTGAEDEENSTTLTSADDSRPSTSNDAMYKSPTITEEHRARTTPKTTKTPIKEKACEEGSIRVERVKTLVGADAELHEIRLEIANLEKLIAVSKLHKARYEEEGAKLALEKLKETL